MYIFFLSLTLSFSLPHTFLYSLPNFLYIFFLFGLVSRWRSTICNKKITRYFQYFVVLFCIQDKQDRGKETKKKVWEKSENIVDFCCCFCPKTYWIKEEKQIKKIFSYSNIHDKFFDFCVIFCCCEDKEIKKKVWECWETMQEEEEEMERKLNKRKIRLRWIGK